ncbi:MAG: AAA family ATPase [Flammeovirgaceae bacterium]
MNIKELKIKGFKSIGEIVLKSPNPFSVFVGANGAGKSNIFEALEFFNYCNSFEIEEAIRLFGNFNEIRHQNLTSKNDEINLKIDLGILKPEVTEIKVQSSFYFNNKSYIDASILNLRTHHEKIIDSQSKEFRQLVNFSRLFIGNTPLKKINAHDDSKLTLDASNLEKVIKRIFRNAFQKNEILEIIQLLVPEFERAEIISEELSGTDNLIIYEKSLRKPLTKHLISDGTYNILAILAAFYQSDTPQFLCIEEPENGLNPKVVRELVNIIRTQCEDRGHYIWLNTHSQTLVSELRPEEIILVDKKNGMTQTKQVTGMDLHGLKMDEALLTNSLGGGIPW